MLEDSFEILTQKAAELKNKPKPTLKDIIDCLVGLIALQNPNTKRVDHVESKVAEIEEKQTAHDLEIETNKKAIKTMQSTLEFTEKSLHLMEQKKIDNDIFLSQFDSKPNVPEVTQKLMHIYKMPQEAVLDSYSIPLGRPKANSTPQGTVTQKYAMIISFREYAAKRKFLEARKTLGPLKLAQIQSTLSNERTIKSANRLSAFNMKTQRILSIAKTNKSIHNFHLHNGLFRFKMTEGSPWQIIRTERVLDKFTAQDEDRITTI